MKLSDAEQKLLEIARRFQIEGNNPEWEEQYERALLSCRSSSIPWLQIKTWGTTDVDQELDGHVLEQLNKRAVEWCMNVISTCAGHPNGISGYGVVPFAPRPTGPSFALEGRSRISTHALATRIFRIPTVEIESRLCHNGKKNRCYLQVASTIVHNHTNQAELATWWSRVLKELKK